MSSFEGKNMQTQYNVPTSLNKDNWVVKITEFNTLKTVVNNLEKKIPDAVTLGDINKQFNASKQNLEKQFGDDDKKVPDASDLVTTSFLNRAINEVENKIPNTGSSVTTDVLNTKK